jgi:ABC-type nitrate/sulfonate/bicarbonate transport system substrate-binding protein
MIALGKVARLILMTSSFFLGGMNFSLFAQDKLTVAMLQSPTQTPVWVALESGFFKEYGLDVVPVQFNGGTQTIMALCRGICR